MIDCLRGRRCRLFEVVFAFSPVFAVTLPAGREQNIEACAFRQASLSTSSATDSGESRVHHPSADAAKRLPDAREEQSQVIVNLGLGADGRTRIAGRVLLADRDGRGDAADFVDVGLVHPLEKLPRISRQRLDIAALSFGVDRVEGEGRLTGAADAGNHGHLVYRDGEGNVFEVINACSPDFNCFFRHRSESCAIGKLGMIAENGIHRLALTLTAVAKMRAT